MEEPHEADARPASAHRALHLDRPRIALGAEPTAAPSGGEGGNGRWGIDRYWGIMMAFDQRTESDFRRHNRDAVLGHGVEAWERCAQTPRSSW